jgi:selenocysteine lyase/cysteine desulfurase
MATMPLPDCDPQRVSARLASEHGIEIPGILFEGRSYLRVSCAAYTVERELERLLEALPAALAG